jgi:hypothetical protein
MNETIMDLALLHTYEQERATKSGLRKIRNKLQEQGGNKLQAQGGNKLQDGLQLAHRARD